MCADGSAFGLGLFWMEEICNFHCQAMLSRAWKRLLQSCHSLRRGRDLELEHNFSKVVKYLPAENLHRKTIKDTI